MQKSFNNSSVPRYDWLSSDRVIRALEFVQDLIIISVCIGLFSFMVMQIRERN